MISASTKTLGIIGGSVSHSLSPALQNRWMSEQGLDAVYLPLPVAPGDLPAAILGLKAAGFTGANVTIPHKEEALSLCDKLSESAQILGAVNTLHFENGTVHGHNTDAAGFISHMVSKAPDWLERLAGRPALVLGAGGAARAVVFGLLKAGCSSVIVTNRSQDRAEALRDQLSAIGPIEVIPWTDRNKAVSGAGLIVNTTSLGMTGHPALEIDLTTAKRSTIVYDIVYAPLETELLQGASAKDLTSIDGLGMLIEQGRAAFQIWFGILPPFTETQRADILAILHVRENG